MLGKATLFDLYDVFGGVTKRKDSFGKGTPVLDVKTIIHSSYIPDNLSLENYRRR